MDWLLRETRFALRSIARRPGFSALVALTLALGIGANTAIFTVVNGVLLSSLSYPDPNGLVVVGDARQGGDATSGFLSLPDIEDLEAESEALTTLVGYSASTATLIGMGDPVVVSVGRVSTGLLSTFHLSPVVGRDVLPGESGASAARVAVISHAFWRERYQGEPSAVGRTITLSATAYRIVGVAPPGFDFPSAIDIWYPREIDPEECGRGCHTWFTIGRLAPDATIAGAQAEVDAIAARLRQAYPDTNHEKAFAVRTLRDDIVGEARTGLWLLQAAGLAVLLIACANVANLMLARAEARQGEAAVRSALGATPGRLVLAMLAESAVLATLGGALGLLLAGGGVAALRRMAAGTVPRVEVIAIDPAVLMFTLGLVAAVTLLFGLSPALRASRSALAAGARRAGRGEIGGGRGLRRVLTATQTAMALVLLFGAGLMLRTFAEMYAVDPGYETSRILRFDLRPPSSAYPDLESVRSFYRTLEERIRGIPGVEAVGSAFGTPLGRWRTSGDVLVEGRPPPGPAEETSAAVRSVGPGYLETMRIPILRGRALVPSDDASELHVAVVNETFVRENFADSEPIGERVRVTVDQGYGSPYWEIVGIAADVRSRSLIGEPEAEIYVPQGLFGPNGLTVNIRAVASVAGLLSAVRSEVRRLDANIPLQTVETVADAVRSEVAPTRFLLAMVGAFAGLALVLAAVGMYGVMAYLVSHRLREIGVRIALGAKPGDIRALVLNGGLGPAIVGLAIGLALALAGGRVVEGLLYGVTPRDPITLLAVPTLLLAVAVVAVIVPATRASRVDPVKVLRSD